MALGDFTVQADAYRARPGYPPALVDRLLARAGVAPGDLVADLGAGTGIFTALLAERGLRVVAIEPGAAMRAQAAPHPRVTWQDGTFEAPGLADGAVRWITAAQAFHWADAPRALPALARALAPGGSFTCLWNNRCNDDSALLRAVMATITRLVPAFDEHYRERDWSAVLDGPWFAPAVVDEERHVIVMSRARFASLWRSHNLLAETAGPGLPGVLAVIDELIAPYETIDVPYLTRAWTARRR
ncbi:MAG TPA: methyltransferase domain-containing protein [Kofleriaceae bacterium]|nr:methyltransferase domain-containing protein [Kofleriaceae bacterium]